MTTKKAPLLPIVTAENTPVPGGGRWRWDAAMCAWAEVAEPPAPDAPAELPTVTLATTEITPE
ncbi:MAG: hypothetical protein Q8R67_05135 [Rhodoferax sp.]|nr:hypothetical protein [Rhodoferax sp.]MDP3651050.1 hypothetical protein [Rhodoferax sp.]